MMSDTDRNLVVAGYRNLAVQRLIWRTGWTRDEVVAAMEREGYGAAEYPAGRRYAND